ncbi:TRAP transporter substrate-binding protein [Marispirochaeta aestuarii]|uniref:TRAP transporter substrate-binding protein n=1 Tax=Marispirochaeta aestuarii TaxID=1963862 RepID=UPI001301A3B0|nr:TRAP transporter substrate-binding protein [Marispirochaeta aestuarii]
MSRVVLLFFLIIGSVGIAFAAGNQDTAGSVSGDAPKEMVVATFHSKKGTPSVDGLFKFKEILEQKTDKIDVQVFFGGTMGGERELVEQVKLGTVHMCIEGWGTKGTYLKKVIPWGVPYLFSSSEEITATIQGKIGQEVSRIFENNGMVWAGEYFRGNRQLTSNMMVRSPEDLKGLKLRLPENPDWIVVWKEFGSLPTPIPSPEVFAALQTGVVDAQENPISSNYDKRLWEVQKYTILTNHIVDLEGYVLSKQYLDGLSPDLRQIVLDSAKEALEWATETSFSNEDTLKADMESKGMEFVKVDLKPFQETALSTMPHFQETWEPWVIDEVRKVVGK